MSWQRRQLQRVVRALLRAAYPDYELQQQQLVAVAKAVARVEKGLAVHSRRQDAAVKELSMAVRVLAPRTELERLRRELGETRGLLARHARTTATLLRRGDARSEGSRAERAVRQRLARLAASDRPLVVGPWMGEVGFELLYWVPFVAWFQQEYDIDPDRLIVLSRGGVSSWYAHVAHRYVDLLTYATPEEYREATNAVKKQRGVTAFDRRILRRVARGARWGRVRILHPQLMYRLFWEFWKGTAPSRRVAQYAAFAPLLGRGAADSRDRPPGLPASYVAARFYFSNAFPDTAQNRAFVADTLMSLAEVTDVVLLNTPFRLDDHSDAAAAAHPRIHTIGEMPPERNLAIQTEVIRGARAFVGTYGGYAYLAPFCQVPSVSFYSTDAFFRHHLDLAQQALAEIGAASLVAMDTCDTGIVRAALRRTGIGWPPPVPDGDRVLKP